MEVRKSSRSVRKASKAVQRRFWILGGIFVLVLIYSVVFGTIIWIRIDRIQGQLTNIVVGDGDDDYSDYDEDPDYDAFLGISSNENVTYGRSKRGDGSVDTGPKRVCLGCCRVCDCSGTKGKPLVDGKAADRSCLKCCKHCRGHDTCIVRSISDHISDVFRPRIAQFIGMKASEVVESGSQQCAPRRKKPIINDYAPTTEIGVMCRWKYAKWVSKKARRLYDLRANGTVKVSESGLYFVYGRISLNETAPYANQALRADKGLTKIELSTCVESAGYSLDPAGHVADSAGKYRTCNMAAYSWLEEGTEVYLGVFTNNGHKMKFNKPSAAYFGIAKY